MMGHGYGIGVTAKSQSPIAIPVSFYFTFPQRTRDEIFVFEHDIMCTLSRQKIKILILSMCA